ncbi:MAG: TonB-dependent receptor [Limisphaera sp.]|nr:TonB-dependent receptor [Limisphaera sp.]
MPPSGWRVDNTLKLPATLHDTPRSLTVYDENQLRELNVRSPVDAFYYTPGVFPNAVGNGAYHFIARGFRMLPSDTLIDGFQGFYVGGGQGPLSMYGIERMIILRGPAGLQYGAATMPGGVVNLITKRPQDQPLTRLDFMTFAYAGHGLDASERLGYGLELDSTGPATASGRVLYRVVTAADNSDMYTDDVLYQTRYLSAALTFRLDETGRHSFTPMVQYSDNKRPAGLGMVISPSTSLSLADGLTGPLHTDDMSPLSVNLWEGGRMDKILVTGFDFDSRPTDRVSFHAAYRANDYDSDIQQWNPQVNTAAQRNLLRQSNLVYRTQSKSQADRLSHLFDVHTVFAFELTDWWKDRFQVGINGRKYDAKSRSAVGPLSTPQSPIHIYTGSVLTPVRDLSTGWGAWTTSDEFHWNIYAQNQAALWEERWILTLGLGYGQQHYKGAATRKSDAVPAAGLLYKLTPTFALYTSYATSYQPADPTLEDYSGRSGVFDPQTGVNYEAGAKYDVANGRASMAAAWFWTERDNEIIQDTSRGQVNVNGRPYYIQQSGQRATGIELAAEIWPLEGWRLSATFAWIDASYERGPFPKPVAKTPEFSWSLQTRYDFLSGPLKGIGIAGGCIWQGERMAGNAARTMTSPDPLMLPAFWRVDAALFYRINEHLDLALHVQNLFDETIFVDGTTGANLQMAAPRTLTLRASYKF